MAIDVVTRVSGRELDSEKRESTDSPSRTNRADESFPRPIAEGPNFFGPSCLKPWPAFGFAIAVTGITLALRLALVDQLKGRPTLIVFVVPIMLSAYLGGLRAGLLATVLSYFAAAYYLLPPMRSFQVAYAVDRWDVFFVLVAGVGISVLNEALHRARRRADIATGDLQATLTLVKVETLQSAIFRNASFSSIVTDEKGVIQTFNIGAERLLGYQAAEVVNKFTPADFSDPEELTTRARSLSAEFGATISEGFEAMVFKASHGMEDIYEFSRIRKDGSRYPAILSVTALRNAQDGIIGYLLIGTDNSARKRAEEDRNRFFALSQDVFCTLGFDGYFKDLNPAWEKTLGYTKEELLAMPFIDFIHPDDRPATLVEAEKVSGGKALNAFENRYRCKDGSYRWFQWSVTPAILDRVMYGVARDITERKQAEMAAIRLAAIVDSSDDAIIGKDLDGIITSWNKGAEKIFGYIAGEITGTSIKRLIPSGREDEEAQILAKIKQGESTDHFETLRQTKDGRLISVSVTASPIKDSTGRVTGVSKVARDITGRKVAEIALQESEARFRTMANSMPQLAWMARADGFIFWYNLRWFEYTGTTQEQMEGWGWQSVHDPEVLPRVMEGWKGAIEAGNLFETKFPIRGANGKFRTFLTRVQPLKDSAGRVMQWFGTNTDVDELKLAEEKVRLLNDELEQRVTERTSQLEAANKELEAFSYSVSHDLRAPLRGVNGYVRMLKEDCADRLDAEGHRLLDVVSSEAKRMGQLIDDLLAFSRLGREQMGSGKVDMTGLARGVFEMVTRAPLHPVPRFELKPLPVAQGDISMLRQVFVNLIGNAVKFTRHQSAANIEVGGSSGDGYMTYYIKDNGVGFDDKYLHKLFGVFQRLHSEEEFEGTGVGLALVQRVIQRHGGKVWAEGKLDQGATFYFTLPIRKGPANE